MHFTVTNKRYKNSIKTISKFLWHRKFVLFPRKVEVSQYQTEWHFCAVLYRRWTAYDSVTLGCRQAKAIVDDAVRERLTDAEIHEQFYRKFSESSILTYYGKPYEMGHKWNPIRLMFLNHTPMKWEYTTKEQIFIDKV